MAAFQADDGYEEPHVIAEIGCNHMGQFEIAKELLTCLLYTSPSPRD